jgi:hypothetical protein
VKNPEEEINPLNTLFAKTRLPRQIPGNSGIDGMQISSVLILPK